MGNLYQKVLVLADFKHELSQEETRQRDFMALTSVSKDPEKRRKIEQVLDSFNELDRGLLFQKAVIIARYLAKICGENAMNALLLIIGRATPEVESYLEKISDKGSREWLGNINRKYISIYEGLFFPFPHDWYRVFWNVHVDTSHGNTPCLSLTFLKRNGERVYLDMPFIRVIDTINYQLQQMKKFQEAHPEAAPGLGLVEQFKQTQKSVEEILNAGKKEIDATTSE